MINNKRVIALIPARGGSKTVPLKNIKKLRGKPLLAWTTELALAIPEIDRVIVSTDSATIADVAKNYGAEVYDRPTELATDTALVVDTIRDLLQRLAKEGESADYLLLLEATCPLRSAEDISDCLKLLSTNKYDSVATFSEAALNPHRAWKIHDNTPEIFIPGAIPWLPRQKLPHAYQLNGAVYALNTQALSKDSPHLLAGHIGAIITPRERAIDIDDELDFLIVETIMNAKKEKL